MSQLDQFAEHIDGPVYVYDDLLRRSYRLDDIDGWTVVAFVRASDGQTWHAWVDVTKGLVGDTGWWGTLFAFGAVQRRLTKDAPPFDPAMIEWKAKPWVYRPYEEEEA